MKMNERALQMLQELSDAPGASGYEDAVVNVARKYAAPIGELKEDFLRNMSVTYLAPQKFLLSEVGAN